MTNIWSWRQLRRRVPRIVTLNLTELSRLGINQRLRTLGRLFRAHQVTLEGFQKTIIYKERNTQNWIRVTADDVLIYINGRYRNYTILDCKQSKCKLKFCLLSLPSLSNVTKMLNLVKKTLTKNSELDGFALSRHG